MSGAFTESVVEDAALGWLEALDDALRKLTCVAAQSLVERNRAVIRLSSARKGDRQERAVYVRRRVP